MFRRILRLYIRRVPPFFKSVSCHEQPGNRSQAPPAAPPARGCAPQLREAAARRARRLRRGRHRRDARRHRAPRARLGIGTLYRHFPTRQHLLEAVYLDEVEAISPPRGRSRRPAAVGRARASGCASSSATRPPSARSRRRCSARSTAMPRCSAPARAAITSAGERLAGARAGRGRRTRGRGVRRRLAAGLRHRERLLRARAGRARCSTSCSTACATARAPEKPYSPR